MDSNQIELRRLCPTIGAEVEGVDLSEALTADIKDRLHAALLEHKVLFFRNQNISVNQQMAFARSFGDLEVHPFFKPSGIPELLEIVHDENSPPNQNNWHTDASWRLTPPFASVLRAVEVPKVGGDTLFADMCAAYESLSFAMQRMLSSLTAIHDFSHILGRNLEPAKFKEMQAQYPPAEHPVIRTHPGTGRKLIFVNPAFTTHIVGLAPEESKRLLEYLYLRTWTPEFQCRFRWERNSIAFWDNRATQHYAVGDYFPNRRVMHGLRIVGDKPY